MRVRRQPPLREEEVRHQRLAGIDRVRREVDRPRGSQHLLVDQEVAAEGRGGLAQDDVGGIRDDGWSAAAAHCLVAPQEVANRRGRDGGARPERIDRDTAAKLLGHPQDAHAHSELGHGVGQVGAEPARRHVQWGREVEDVWIVGLEQMGQTRLGAEEGSARVDLLHQIVAFHRCLEGSGQADGAGVVDQNIDPAEALDGPGDALQNLRIDPNVHHQRKRVAASPLDLLGGGEDGAGQLGMRLGGLGSDCDVGPVLCGAQSDSEPDAPTGSRDEECFPAKRAHSRNCLRARCQRSMLADHLLPRALPLRYRFHVDFTAIRSTGPKNSPERRGPSFK